MELIERQSNLPVTVDELHEFILIGRERLQAHKAKLRAIDKIPRAHKAKEAALTDAQTLGDVLIDAEARLGELLAGIPPQSSQQGRLRTIPNGISHKESHEAQTIANHPEIIERVKERAREEKTIPTAQEVYREIKRQEAKAKIEELASRESTEPNGPFDVIVVDPPWPIEKIERDCRPNQHLADYPTMTIEEISSIRLDCAEDCHVFLWTTHRFLPSAFEILNIWELRYVCAFVWHKPGGYQPHGLPQYNCEFVLYARKGHPIFIETKDFFTCFQAPRGKHSEKPEDFYAVLRRVTVGRRADYFNRRIIDGFTGIGNQAMETG